MDGTEKDLRIRSSKSTKKPVRLMNEQHAAFKVLLITDIGGDIDDVLALYLLLAHLNKKVDLLGIVVCGGVHAKRAFLTRQLLQRLMGDSAGRDVQQLIRVIAPSGDENIRSSHEFSMPDELIPEWERSTEQQQVDEDASQFIIDTVNKNAGMVNVMIIGPLTPLSNAIMKDPYFARNIRRLYIQGQIVVPIGDRLEPDVQNSYNMREDQFASRVVFSNLQNHKVPFVSLGKYAAYRVPIPKSLFESLSSSNGAPIHILSYLRKALESMWDSAPDLLYRIYKIPEEHQTKDKWFDSMSNISYPYDPLLILSLLEPELFEPQIIELNSVQHSLIGNSPDQHGIPSPDIVATRLMKDIVSGGSLPTSPSLLLTLSAPLMATVSLFLCLFLTNHKQ